MSGDDPRDEGTWLDDMPPVNPFGVGALDERGAIGNAARRWERAHAASRADEDARARVRRIGVDR